MEKATTKQINRDGKNQVFISTLNSAGKIRISVVEGTGHRTYKDSEILFQETFTAWNDLTTEIVTEINALISPVEEEVEKRSTTNQEMMMGEGGKLTRPISTGLNTDIHELAIKIVAEGTGKTTHQIRREAMDLPYRDILKSDLKKVYDNLIKAITPK